VGAACLVLVAIPQSWRDHLRIDQLLGDYLGVVSIAGIAALVIWSIYVLADVATWAGKRYKMWRFGRSAPKRIRELSDQEKVLLGEYLRSNRMSVVLPYPHGVAEHLQDRGYLQRMASFTDQFDPSAPYNLLPWVQKVLFHNESVKKDILAVHKRYADPAL